MFAQRRTSNSCYLHKHMCKGDLTIVTHYSHLLVVPKCHKLIFENSNSPIQLQHQCLLSFLVFLSATRGVFLSQCSSCHRTAPFWLQVKRNLKWTADALPKFSTPLPQEALMHRKFFFFFLQPIKCGKLF